jgi:tight adherence protein C
VSSALAFLSAALLVLAAGQLLPSERHGPRFGALPRWLRALSGLAARRTPPLDLERRIAAAGRPAGLGAREWAAARMAGAVCLGGAAVVPAAVAPGRLGLLVVVASPVAGFLAPDLWLARRARDRARRVRRELPVMLDLLRVPVTAGASLPAALADVGARSRGPLAAEWRAVGSEVALGVPLSEALEAMSTRLPQPEVCSLCAALDRARRHGAPLGRTLAGQAADARLALRRRVAEDAARAGPKIQLVVALMLVPSVLLMVAAALASALLGRGDLAGS